MNPAFDISSLLQLGGTVTALLLFLTAFLKGWVVTRSVYLDVIRDRDDWREAALTQSDATDHALIAARQSIESLRNADMVVKATRQRRRRAEREALENS